MDGLTLTLLAAAAAAGAAAGGAALWRQRRLEAELRRQAAQADTARRELGEQLRDIAVLLQPAPEGTEPNDTESRKRALERVLDAAAANGPHGGAAEFPWLETLPHGPPDAEKYSFASTEPAALDRTVDIPLDRH